MCDRIVSEDPFILIFRSDRYKTPKFCDKAFDGCLAAIKFFYYFMVTSKMLEKCHDALLSNDDILFFYDNFSKVYIFY